MLRRPSYEQSSAELYSRLIGTLSALVNVSHIAEMNTWIWIVVGILQSESITLRKIATHVHGETQAESRVAMIRRWLKNYPVRHKHERCCHIACAHCQKLCEPTASLYFEFSERMISKFVRFG
jgi:hypothetical protein